MSDPRETAQKKEKGKKLAQAPRRRRQGPGSPLGHLVAVNGQEKVTVSGGSRGRGNQRSASR